MAASFLRKLAVAAAVRRTCADGRTKSKTSASSTASGNRDVTVKELPGLNHLFQTAPTGAPTEYATIEETFAPAALQVIGDWITKHTPR